MKHWKLITLVVTSISSIAMSATAGHGDNLRWRDIIGVVDAGNVVGRGQIGIFPDGIPGGAPWSTLSGGAKVNLNSGQVQFEVKGLVLAAGSALGIQGLPIGTPGPITQVVGTLVCDVTGASGDSQVVDTPAVPLSATGDAHFSGKFDGPVPDVCTGDPFPAFLIRITGTAPPPTGFDGVWIASGAVLDH